MFSVFLRSRSAGSSKTLSLTLVSAITKETVCLSVRSSGVIAPNLRLIVGYSPPAHDARHEQEISLESNILSKTAIVFEPFDNIFHILLLVAVTVSKF